MVREDIAEENWDDYKMPQRAREIASKMPGKPDNVSHAATSNLNNNNPNTGGVATATADDTICKIEVVRSRRRADLESSVMANEDHPPTGANNNNIINCNDIGLRNQSEFETPGGDMSNNNKAVSLEGPCVVDNLVMEPEKPSPKAGAIEANPERATQSNDPCQPAVLSPKVSHTSPPAQEMSFADPRQSQVFQMLTGLQQLRKDKELTDVVVRVKDVDFRCHSFVLALNSPYLHALLKDSSVRETETKLRQMKIADSFEINRNNSNSSTAPAADAAGSDEKVKDVSKKDQSCNATKGDDTDKTTGKAASLEGVVSPGEWERFVTLKGIEPNIFSKMLDFMYCCFEDVLTATNCLDMLLASNSVELTHLRRASAACVTDTLSGDNVFRVMQLCDSGLSSLFEPRIMKRAHQVIRENFPQLSLAEDFLRLGRHVVIPLLADSMLHSRSEMEVLQALLRWVKFRPEERCSDMTLMLQHVRFPLMSSRELEKLRDVPILKNNSLAMALIEESRAYGNLDYNERMAWPRHNSISRCLFSTRDLILWTADRDKGLHFYSIIDGQHHKVTSFGQLTAPAPHTGALAASSASSAASNSGGHFSFDSTSSVCCYGDKIFFTGGEFNTDMVWSVDTGSGEVKVHAKMPRGRKFHSMVASKGCVYCLGGQDKRGYTVLEDVDAYIINKDMWVKVGHLAVPAYNMSAAVCAGAVYLVGGLDHAGQPLRIIQCFIALRSGLYSAFKVEVSNMPPSLLSARAVSCGLDKTIYIVCGHGEVYQFEPDRQCMSHVTTLKNLSENPRVRFGLAYVGGCLVVIGGHRLGLVMQEPIRSVCLDIASKTEVRDYSPLLPGDIVNTCLAAKLSSNILRLFSE